MTHKNGKKFKNLMFWSAGCSLLSAEGFSCSLDVLCGGLRISKYIFWSIKEKKKKNHLYFFLQFFGYQILDLDPDSLEMLDPDLDPDSLNLDPKYLVRSWQHRPQVSCEQGAAVPPGQPTTVLLRRSAWAHAVIFRIRYGGYYSSTDTRRRNPRNQGFGSGSGSRSVLDADSIRSNGSGTKMTNTSRIKFRNFMFWSAGCFF